MKNFLTSLKRTFGKKKFKYGTYSVLITAVGIAVIVLINLGLSQLESNYDIKIDLTQNKQFSLSETTIKTLDGLQKDVYIYPIYQSGNENKDLLELLQKYKVKSSRIHVADPKDPDMDPLFIAKFKTSTSTSISSGSVIVTDADNKLYRVLNQADMYATQTDSNTGSQSYDFKGESVVTGAINYIASGYMPNAYIVTGHSEVTLANLGELESTLKGENYNVESINIAQAPDKIKAGDIVMFFGPTKDISEQERDILKPLMEKGGRFFFLFDTYSMGKAKADLPNLFSLLQLYDVSLKPGLVVEADPTYMMDNQYPTLLAPKTSTTSEITSSLDTTRSPVIVLNSGAIALPEVPPDKTTTTITSLLTSSPSSYLKPYDAENIENTKLTKAEGDEAGPLALAASIEKKNSDKAEDSARIVVFANVDFATIASQLPYSNSNENLLLNSMGWLKSSAKDIYIRSKPITNPVIGFTNAAERILVLLTSVLLIPIIALVVGIVVYLRRKHL